MTRELKKILNRWQTAWNAGDLVKVMSLFDKKFILSQQGWPDSDFATVARGYAFDFKTNPPGARWNGVLEETFERGKLAVAISRWEFSANRKGKRVVLERLRCVDVLRRKGKEWKFVRTLTYPEKK